MKPAMPLGSRRPPAPARRKPPWILPVSLGIAALLAVAIALLRSTDSKPPPTPRPPVPPTLPVEPSLSFHLRDLGNSFKISILLPPIPPLRPEDLLLLDAAGNRYPSRPDDPRDCFLRELQKTPAAKALSFQAPAGTESLDLLMPGPRTVPVYRKPGPEAFRPAGLPVRYEDWEILARGSFVSDSIFDLEILARPAVDRPIPLLPQTFLLLTDDGHALNPQVRKEGDPLRLRYTGLSPPLHRLRIQTRFRGERPEYLVFDPPSTPREALPASPGGPPLAPPLPPSDLRSTFEARLRSDPLEALRVLVAGPPEEARRLAREALARRIPEDLSNGIQAFQEGKAGPAETFLVRAALLAEPYAPDLSFQLIRMLTLLGAPRRIFTGCASCGGKGTSACANCRQGSMEGPCPRCGASGRVPCLLCEGAGTMDHTGFRGTLVITLPRDLRVQHRGRAGILKAQTLTYQMEPCQGGQFQLRTDSVLAADGSRKTDSVLQSCTRFWEEMKLFVFTGKARIAVLKPPDRTVPLSPTAARRFFADYEHCRNGRLPCDRCGGEKSELCASCAGRRVALLACAHCEGTGLKICPACRGHGPSDWLAALLPADAAPELGRALSQHAARLREWLDERRQRASRREDLARRLEEAKKGLDPTAKLTPHTLEVTCPRCRGKGGECEECWSTGRREFYEGTPLYERYALAERLKQRLEESAGVPPPEPPVLTPLSALEPATTRPVSPPPLFPPPPLPRPKGLAKDGPLPQDVQEHLRRADSLWESGRAHLERAKTSADPAAGAEAAARAVADLLQARTLYATAQEQLADLGIEPPRELLQKFRLVLQALVMARRSAP